MMLEINVHTLRYSHCGVGICSAVVPGIKIDDLSVLVKAGATIMVSTIAKDTAVDMIKHVAIPTKVECLIEAGEVFVEQPGM